MSDIALSLVAHTNVGKTTLARTLLGRDVGEVRDAPHVTEFAEGHLLLASAQGDRLWLWDTPGFGDSVRLARRMRQQGSPLGWLLSQAWDRWRDRAFWASQQALGHVRERSDLLLYLVNAAEPQAGWLEAELELLAWTGKPVLVLLNQLGPPRPAADEAAELAAWRERLERPAARGADVPDVRGVLPLDAFARCWVQEGALLDAVAAALPQPGQAAAVARLRAAWQAAQQARFDAAVQVLAASLGRVAATRVAPDAGVPALGARLRGLLERLRAADDATAGAIPDVPEALARARLAEGLQDEVRAGTERLIELHGLAPGPGAGPRDPFRDTVRDTVRDTSRDTVLDDVLARVAGQVSAVERVDEGRAALWGGAVTGALAGLKADVASGGLTLGGGLLAGGLIGALSAAGVARGLNVVRGSERSWATWDAAALAPVVEAALLRYLAVAHFGRGRGGWQPGEAPPHWAAVVRAALEPDRAAWQALWRTRGRGAPGAPGAPGASGTPGAADAEAAALAAGARPLLAAAARRALEALYPGAVAAAAGSR